MLSHFRFRMLLADSLRKLTLSLLIFAAVAASSAVHAESAVSADLPEKSTGLLSTDQMRDTALATQAFGAYLSAWSSKAFDTATLSNALTEGAVLELGIARLDCVFNVKGTAAIEEFARDVDTVATDWSFSGIHYFPTLERHVVFVQYDASFTRVASGNVETKRHLAVIELKEDRISRIRDFADSRWILDALLTDAPKGFSAALRQ